MERDSKNKLDEGLRRIYPVRYCAIFLFADDKQDSIISFMSIENGLSHGVNGRLKNVAFESN